MDAAAEKKNAIRQVIYDRRRAIPAELQAEKSHTICDALIAYVREKASQRGDAQKPFCVAAYYELKNEVALGEFRASVYAEGWKLVLPCMWAPGDMQFYAVRPDLLDSDLPFLQHPARNYTHNELMAFLDERGISREACVLVQPKDIDFMVVPLVGFNDAGARLGYGGGNYDRFIPQMRKDVELVGIAFDEQYWKDLEVEDHDCVMNRVFSA